MKPLRIAVIGVGHLGRSHARILAGRPEVQLVAVVDAHEPARREVAAAHSAIACADHRELLGRIDAAVIATPTSTHAAVARDLLDAGVHLLVEKPLAPTFAEAEELVERAARRQVTLQVGHIERFNPAWEAVRGDLDQPHYIDAVRCGPYTTRSTDIGVVLDLMIHDIDLALSIVRRPLSNVRAVGTAVFGPHEDAATAWLEFDGGCVATLSAARVSPQAARKMQVWTASNCVSLDFMTRTAQTVRPCEALRVGQLNVELLDPSERQRLRERLFEDYLPRTEVTAEARDQLTAELLDFVAAIRAPRAPRVSGAHGRDAIGVAEAILSQIAERRAADPESCPAGPPKPHFLRRQASEQRRAG